MDAKKFVKLNTLLAITIVLLYLACQFPVPANAAELSKSSHSGRLENFFAVLKVASRQGKNYVADLLETIPFKKIILSGGALLSLFFIFVRLLVVLGPILILGALTRESTDATDLMKILIEFYNQVIVALDDQMSQQSHQPLSI